MRQNIPRGLERAWVQKEKKVGESMGSWKGVGLEDPAGSMNVLRMDQVKFEELVALILPAIKKQDTVMTSSIS